MTRPKVFLDTKGLITHMFYRGEDPNSIITDTGEKVPTAGWGFSNWLEEYFFPIMKDYRTSDVFVVWDGGSDYRTSLFPAYKAARIKAKEKKPPEEIEQLKLLESAVKSFTANLGIINVYVEGVEADDTIALLCEAYKDEMKVIHTVDADLLQLDDDKTYVFIRNEPVKETYKGIPLNLIRLEKCTVGDKSDGYNGVYRFGEKAWKSLVDEFGYDGMEEIENCIATKDYKLMSEVLSEPNANKALAHLFDNRKEAEKAYKLASLHPEVCYGFYKNRLVWPKYYSRIPTKSVVEKILVRMGCALQMHNLVNYFPTEELVTAENVEDFTKHFMHHLEQTPYVSFDYETVDTLNHQPFAEALPKNNKSGYLDVLSSEITGCSFNYGANSEFTIYLSTGHKDTNNLSKDHVRNFLQIVEHSGIPLVAHNASFEALVSKLNLAYEPQKTYDTMIMASYVNENEEFGLKSLTKRLFSYDQASYKDVLQGAGAEDMAGLSGQQVLSYGCDDSLCTSHLFNLFQLVLNMEGMWEFYKGQERAPVHVLNNAFETGITVDYEKIDKLHKKADKVITEGMVRLRELLADNCKEPNPEASKHLSEMDGDNLQTIAQYKESQKEGGKRVSDDALLAKRQERLLHWEEATVYKPYTETYIPPEFLGTATQINIVAEQLGIDLEEFSLSSIANVRINEYITRIRHHYGEDIPKIIAQFIILLAEAVGPGLKKREGPMFEALKEFCMTFMGKGKIEKDGDELNFNSPPQMQQLLYCKLGAKVRRRTKVQKGSTRATLGLNGSPANDEKAMQLAIAEDCQGDDNEWKREVLTLVMDIKEQQTMISLYYRPYPLWQHPRDGRVHPQIRNCGTVTRRPTGGNPNLLQVKKGETRTIVKPLLDDHVIVAIDFSGQELRITGSESMDPVLIDAYTGGGFTTDVDGMVHPVTKDIHSVTAIAFAETIFRREIGTGKFDITYENFREWLFCDDPQLSKAANLCRKMAKVVNFLIIYGGQASTLAMGLGIPEEFAEELMRMVFATYSRLAPWQEETIQYARSHGYVKTAYGNLKHLTDDIRSRDGSLRSRQERQAVNQTVQGCAADILKVVLTETYETDIWRDTGSVMIAPVYDEIVSSVPMNSCFEYCQRMQDIMNVTPPGHSIPMMAEVSIGKNWGEVVELGDRPSQKKVESLFDKFLEVAA